MSRRSTRIMIGLVVITLGILAVGFRTEIGKFNHDLRMGLLSLSAQFNGESGGSMVDDTTWSQPDQPASVEFFGLPEKLSPAGFNAKSKHAYSNGNLDFTVLAMSMTTCSKSNNTGKQTCTTQWSVMTITFDGSKRCPVRYEERSRYMLDSADTGIASVRIEPGKRSWSRMVSPDEVSKITIFAGPC